jgi:hypothetical protein
MGSFPRHHFPFRKRRLVLAFRSARHSPSRVHSLHLIGLRRDVVVAWRTAAGLNELIAGGAGNTSSAPTANFGGDNANTPYNDERLWWSASQPPAPGVYSVCVRAYVTGTFRVQLQAYRNGVRVSSEATTFLAPTTRLPRLGGAGQDIATDGLCGWRRRCWWWQMGRGEERETSSNRLLGHIPLPQAVPLARPATSATSPMASARHRPSSLAHPARRHPHRRPLAPPARRPPLAPTCPCGSSLRGSPPRSQLGPRRFSTSISWLTGATAMARWPS